MDGPEHQPWVARGDPRAPRQPDDADGSPVDDDDQDRSHPAAAPPADAVAPDDAAAPDDAVAPADAVAPDAVSPADPTPAEDVAAAAAGAAEDAPHVVARPIEASPATAPRRPVALAGTALVGFAMGAADVVPGFSGGTVALVAGIYERLIANVRQGARTLSLLIRGQTTTATRSLAAIEWPFVVALLGGILIAVFTLAATLRRLLETEPVAMSATFLGLVLGAAAVATRELRRPVPGHAVVVVAAAVATFVGLGLTPGTFDDPSLLLVFGAGALAICAMILPGVSGSFLLLMVGMYGSIIAAVDDRRMVILLVFTLGCVTGLAAFSTLLNWLLRRFHDLVLSVLLGLMLGSVRVLWPWPADQGVGGTDLGAPHGNEWLLAAALGFGAFGVVWTFGLITGGRAPAKRSGRQAGDPPYEP